MKFIHMKYSYFLLLVVSLQSIGQVKKDNTIIIKEVLPLSKIKAVLFSNGYILEPSADTVYLSTQGKEMRKESIAIKILIAKGDSVTLIKGLYKPTISLSLGLVSSESDYSQLDFSGGKGSPYRKAWNEMNRIALLFSENISYTKE